MNFHWIFTTTSLSMQLALIGLALLVCFSVLTLAFHEGVTDRRYRGTPRRDARRAATRSGSRWGVLWALTRLARNLHEWVASWQEPPEVEAKAPAEEPESPETPEPPEPAILHADPDPDSRHELKKLYRAMMKTWHPDLCQDPARRELHAGIAVRINELYEAQDLPGLRKLQIRLERVGEAA